MRFGKHEPRPPKSRRTGFRPRGERLEARELLAIDLVNIAGTTGGTTPGPYGVLESGLNNNGGVGFSVAEVGDVNGDGFDDFVLGQPTIARNGTGVTLGNGGGARAYLVFGSAQVTAPTAFDFLNLVPQQRVGDLSGLGQTLQSNPLNGAPGFNFDGLTFSTGQNPNSALGASVAAVGDVNGDGFADFMIGAPGANDSAGIASAAGRAYLVYGGTNLNRPTKTVDFDNPTANSDLNILTFVNNVPNAATGRAVAFAGDIIPDGLPDIAIGAPNATLNGLPTSGGVYVISGSTLRPARTQTVLLQTVGQGGATNTPGLVFAGASAGGNAGFSIANAGNFAAATVNAQPQTALLIGSPQFNVGPGQVSLIYATAGIANLGTTINGFTSILLNRIGATNGLTGAIFTGANSGDQTGFSVSTAGDFNNDGVADILIGSPGFNAAAGRVNMIFGRNATPVTPGAITGTLNLSTLPTTIGSVEFDGASAGALAGFAVTAVGRVNNDTINEILIGSPGFANSAGIAYLIPGNPDLQGVFSLNNTEASPIQGLIIGLSQPSASPNFLGASVSGRLSTNSAGKTVDGDPVGDFVIGAPGFALNPARVNAGGGFLLEGAFVPLPNVVSTAITSPIGVGKALGPFAINATTPADLTIFILSAGSNTPGFSPSTDIDPTTITVNGIPLPDPTTFTAVADQDGDGIPDASFVFSPRSLLNLPNGTVTFTVNARTNSTSPLGLRRYTGNVPVTVTGGGGGGGGGGLPSTRATAFSNLGADNTSALPFGERLVPSNVILNRLRYKPLPPAVAHQQFLPTGGYAFRFHQFYHPTKNHFGGSATGPNRTQSGHGTYTLGRNVFTRGKFPNGVFKGKINHRGPTIPNNP
ncbi:MAG: repeat protein [Planctomycetota bacterium]|nr:repeat protein [Planctomycetota bacterium]